MYGIPSNGYLLNNDGNGRFSDETKKIAPELLQIGMITDAAWADTDGDDDLDLIITGEYMPLTIFEYNNGTFSNITAKSGLGNTNGWWNTLFVDDLESDGDIDFVAGNHGLNSMFKGNEKEHLQMYVNDFDHNGSVDHIICFYKEGISYPHILKHDLIAQMPGLASKYMNYKNFMNQTIDSIFSPSQLENALVLSASHLETTIAINNGDGTFEVRALPIEAQISPVYAISVHDYDMDGKKDILLAGNLHNVKPEVGRYDASYGTFLKGNGNMDFKAIPASETGLKIEGEARDIDLLDTKQGKMLFISRNNEAIQIFNLK